MNWKAEAIEKLRRYAAWRAAIEGIPEEIAAIKLSMRRIRSATADGTPVQGGSSGREDMLLNSIVRQQELELALSEAQGQVARVDRALAVLTPEERKLLERFYIYPTKGTVDRLCEDLCVEKAQVYRKKDIALQHFTVALYGRTDS